MSRDLLQVRAGLCLEIAEQLESYFTLGLLKKWDADAAGELIDSMLPDTYDEAALRDAQIDESLKKITKPKGPGLGEQMRVALGIPDLSLHETLKAAIDRIKACDEALDLLRWLHDLQNGPPLPQDEKKWKKTMQKAEELLKRYNR